MLTEEKLAQAYNQLDLLVQPEGDAALEALMTHIRELQQDLAQAYGELWLISPDGAEVFLERIRLKKEINRDHNSA
jgi:hypothetical protein